MTNPYYNPKNLTPHTTATAEQVNAEFDKIRAAFEKLPAPTAIPAGGGAPNYTHYAYADSADGTSNFTTGAPGNRSFIGVAVNQPTATPSEHPEDYTWAKFRGADGQDGQDGANGTGAIVAYLTSEYFPLPANTAGAITSYAGASTSMRVFAGPADVSSFFTVSVLANPQDLTVTITDNTAAVVGGFDVGEANASVTLRATGTDQFLGISVDKVFRLGKIIPGAPGTDGLNGTDGVTLYTWIAYADSADGTVNFTNGVPDNRGFQGIAVNKTTPVESTNPADYTWSAYRGPATFGLVAQANVVIGPDYVVKTGATGAWDASAYSSEGAANGAVLSCKAATASEEYVIGLNTDPTTNTHKDSIDYALRLTTGGALYASESGSETNLGTYAAGDVLQIAYDSKRVTYLKNGNVLRQIAATSGLTLYLDTSLLTQGKRISNIRFYPQGAAGLDGTNGAPGTNGITYYTWYAYADSADGVVNFTTGSPNGRVYQGIATGKTTGTESTNPADYTWMPYAGPPSFGLAAANGAEVAGVKIINRTGAGWAAQVYSTESYVGGAVVSFKPELNAGGYYGGVMVGLNTDPTTASWESLDYALYLEYGTGNLYAAESGALIGLGSYSSSDTFAVHYDGSNVRYYKNGAVQRTVSASAGIRFFLDSAMSVGGVCASITGWTAAGAVGPQGPTGSTGTAGAPAIGYVQDATPGPGAFVNQTWYRPTSKEWYRWDGSNWVKILGALSAQDLIADSAYLANGVIISAKIGDLQVDNAKIANLTLTTGKIANDQVTLAMQAYNASTYYAYDFTNTYWNVVQFNVTMDYDGDILLMSTMKQSYSSTARAWNAQLRVGSTIIGQSGGASAISDSVAMSGKLAVSAGTYTVTLAWYAGDSTVSIAAGNASLVAFRRYK